MNKIFFILLIILSVSCNVKERDEVKSSKFIYKGYELNLDSIIGNTNKIGDFKYAKKLEVAEFDFPIKLNWKDANEICLQMGNGWRLPEIDELTLIYHSIDKVQNLKHDYYWSSTHNNNIYAGALFMSNGAGVLKETDQIYFVRVVR